MIAPSIEVQQRSLQNLYNYVGILTRDQMQLIKRHYVNTGLKTNLIFLLISIKEELIVKFDSKIKDDFTQLKENFLKHIDRRINNLTRITLEEAQYADVIFACNQVARQALIQWSSTQAQEITQFKTESLPSVIRMMGALDKSEEITQTFQVLSLALYSENFAEAIQHLDRIQELLPSPLKKIA